MLSEEFACSGRVNLLLKLSLFRKKELFPSLLRFISCDLERMFSLTCWAAYLRGLIFFIPFSFLAGIKLKISLLRYWRPAGRTLQFNLHPRAQALLVELVVAGREHYSYFWEQSLLVRTDGPLVVCKQMLQTNSTLILLVLFIELYLPSVVVGLA